LSERVAAQTQNVADAITPTAQTELLQRKCACSGSAGLSGECDKCRDQKLIAQRFSTGRPPAAPPIAPSSLLSTGRPLDPATLNFMEARFGHNFRAVRVHTDPQAAESARGVNALAYTVGRNIVFGAGQYSPGTKAGLRLLAHELAHTIQQGGRLIASQSKLQVSDPGDIYEREADRIADQVVAGNPSSSLPTITPLGGSSGGIQRAFAGSGELAPSSSEETTEAVETPSDAKIVEDTVAELGPGQMRKSDFLAALQLAICIEADPVLARVGRSSQGCPYLEDAFARASALSSSRLERGLRQYAPDITRASTASEYISIVSARVRRGIEVWVQTGEITGVPAELASEIASPAHSEGTAPAASGNASVLFKGREGGAKTEDADASSIRAQLGKGRTLDGGVRARMERALGYDFSSVHVHTDSQAASLSRRLNARAFTVGADVAFGAGEYQPGTLIGDALIAHELAHVAQQSGGQATVSEKGASYGSALEEDADQSAVGAVLRLWGGGSLAELAHQSMPRLKSGLRLQRCNGGSSPTPTPSPPVPAPPPPAPPPVVPPSDLEVRGIDRSTDASTIFFDRHSHTLDPSQSPKIGPLKAPPGSDLTLFSFTSEDENAPVPGGAVLSGTALATARFTEVDTALKAGPGAHTGPQRPGINITAGVGQIDYRSMRKVVVKPTGAPSGVTSCAAGGEIPCAPASQFTTAQSRAVTLLNNAITALGPPVVPAHTAKFDRRFGTTSATRAATALLVKTNLNNLKTHISTQMTPVGTEGRPASGGAPAVARAAGHRCANECDSGCDPTTIAYTDDIDADSLMTLCDTPGVGFMKQSDVNERAATLIHEGLHGITLAVSGATVPGATDFSYSDQRLIRFLDPLSALQNNDSYVIFVRQVNGQSVTVGRATPDVATGVALSGGVGGEREEVDRALAWLEGWLLAASSDLGSLHGKIKDILRLPAASRAWSGTYYRNVMTSVAAQFGLTVPPGVPTESDKFAVAALFDRVDRLTMLLFRRIPVRINRVSAGTTRWGSGPTRDLTIGPDFFAVGAGPGRHRAQLDLLLAKLIEAAPDISAAARPKYATIINDLRTLAGIGSP